LPGIPGKTRKERIMGELLVFIAVVVVWYLIQGWLLPRMGVST